MGVPERRPARDGCGRPLTDVQAGQDLAGSAKKGEIEFSLFEIIG
jgi:hypothetical protein